MDFTGAFTIQQDIDNKLEQIARLRDLATKTTSVISGMPHGGKQGSSAMENAIVQIIEQEKELEEQIAALIFKRTEITLAIAMLDDRDERTVMELRYLCYKSWSDIAKAMCLTKNRVFYLHRLALQKFKVKNTKKH